MAFCVALRAQFVSLSTVKSRLSRERNISDAYCTNFVFYWCDDVRLFAFGLILVTRTISRASAPMVRRAFHHPMFCFCFDSGHFLNSEFLAQCSLEPLWNQLSWFRCVTLTEWQTRIPSVWQQCSLPTLFLCLFNLIDSSEETKVPSGKWLFTMLCDGSTKLRQKVSKVKYGAASYEI